MTTTTILFKSFRMRRKKMGEQTNEYLPNDHNTCYHLKISVIDFMHLIFSFAFTKRLANIYYAFLFPHICVQS